jgi:hypothetical protein
MEWAPLNSYFYASKFFFVPFTRATGIELQMTTMITRNRQFNPANSLVADHNFDHNFFG